MSATADLSGLQPEYITLRQAAAELPRRRAGKKTSVQTLYRWSNPPGCRGVVLRTIQVGATRCTARRWLDEFFAELTAARTGSAPAPAPPTPTARRRAAERADRELEQIRI